jgi:hypothetical protein
MYTGNLGMIVVAAWLWGRLGGGRWLSWLANRRLRVALAGVYLVVNFAIVSQVSPLYVHRQQEVSHILADLAQLQGGLRDGGTVTVLTHDRSRLPQIVDTQMHLEAMIFVTFDRTVDVTIREQPDFGPLDLQSEAGRIVIGWDEQRHRLTLPAL